MSNIAVTSARDEKTRTILFDYLALTKPGITLMVLFSMGVGFVLGSGGVIDWPLFFHAMTGTVLIAAGTAAHNQFIERDLDKKMIRTLKRPLPAKRINPSNALAFSMTLMIGGLLYLLFLVNPLTGLISAITSLLYLAFYTPLKRISFVNVMVGAVPGALPPVGGWIASSGSIMDPGVWILFGVVFLWQVPHVIAIAWLCEEDYRNAGFRMLPEGDTRGLISAATLIICILLLLPLSYFLYHLEFSSLFYLLGAMATGLFFLYRGFQFLISRTKDNARQVLYGSLIYLPAVWLLILADFFFSKITI